MLKSAWYCGTSAFLGSVRILTSDSSSNECKLTTTGSRPTNSGIIPNSTRSRASTMLRSLSRSALSSRTSGCEFLKMSSCFSLELLSFEGAPKPITCVRQQHQSDYIKPAPLPTAHQFCTVKVSWFMINVCCVNCWAHEAKAKFNSGVLKSQRSLIMTTKWVTQKFELSLLYVFPRKT